MKHIKVLYQYVIDPAMTVFSKWDTCLYVTSKAFADTNHYMSDGPAGDPDYEPIQQALESLGYSETCESIYEVPEAGPIPEPELIQRMAELGFDLIPADFDALFLSND